MKTNWKEYINHRVLISSHYSFTPMLIEVIVLEVSPKGNVNFDFGNGVSNWHAPDDYGIIESLGIPEKKD